MSKVKYELKIYPYFRSDNRNDSDHNIEAIKKSHNLPDNLCSWSLFKAQMTDFVTSINIINSKIGNRDQNAISIYYYDEKYYLLLTIY